MCLKGINKSSHYFYDSDSRTRGWLMDEISIKLDNYSSESNGLGTKDCDNKTALKRWRHKDKRCHKYAPSLRLPENRCANFPSVSMKLVVETLTEPKFSNATG